MLKCPYCGSEHITMLEPKKVSKPRELYKYEFSQRCLDCKKEFNRLSRLLPKKEDPDKILFLSVLPSSSELKAQFSSYNL